MGLLLSGLGVTGPRLQAASSTWLDDQGLFILSVAGREVGQEKFSIRSSMGKIEAQAEIEMHLVQDGKTSSFKIFPNLTLNSELHPLTYTWRQKGSSSSSLEVDFRSSPAKTRYKTVAGETDQRDFSLPRDVVVLDDNVIHHYQLIVSRYNLAAGGKQTFQAFIPQEALPGILTIEDAGTERIQVQGRSELLRHLIVSTELARIDLWADEHRHLQHVAIPAAQLEAVRKQ